MSNDLKCRYHVSIAAAGEKGLYLISVRIFGEPHWVEVYDRDPVKGLAKAIERAEARTGI